MATRYYADDGRYLPGADSPRLAARKERVLARLDGVYERLNAFQDAHEATPYSCQRSGQCCRVGLTLHTAEIEKLAGALERRFEEDPSARPRVLKGLERALRDPEWQFSTGEGKEMCAFYDEGCTIHPDRPGVCRMYGVILELNDECPRLRLASGRDFVWIDPAADAVVRELNATVDAYGRLFPRADCSRYLAAGLSMFLLPRKDVDRLRARTHPRFWTTIHGYRSQFVPSTKKTPYYERIPKIPLRLVRSG